MYSLFDASVGTEELNHIEMVCTIVHQLTRNLTVQQIKEQGFADYYVDHTTGIYPVAASGTPWSADTMQSTGDPITDLMENMAAEQKARTTYDNILRLVKDDPDVMMRLNSCVQEKLYTSSVLVKVYGLCRIT